MGANVTLSVQRASASAARARASVAVIQLDAALAAQSLATSVRLSYARGAVTASVAASAVDYIELAASVYLDETGQFKFLSEAVVVVDVTSKAFAKALVDSYATVDLPAKTLSRSRADTFGLLDLLLSTFRKSFADSQPLADSVARQIGKTLADVAGLSDAAARATSKTLADATAGFSDQARTQAIKALTDDIAISDDAQRASQKSLTDDQVVYDELAFTFARPVVDAFASADAASLTPGKALDDLIGEFAEFIASDVGKALDDALAFVDILSYSITFYRHFDDAFWLEDLAALLVNRPVDDDLLFSDEAELSIDKALSDLTDGFDEALDKDVGKRLDDQLSLADVLAYQMFFNRQLDDATGFEDSLALLFSKVANDEFSTNDAASLLTEKALDDLTDEFADHLTSEVGKSLSDALSVDDLLAYYLIFVRDFYDAFSVIDEFGKSVSLEGFAESVFATDTLECNSDKALADAFGLNDGTEVPYYISKTVNNAVFLSDASSLVPSATKDDSVAVSDYGVAVVQSYCDITYFAEDYVGQAAVF